MNTKTKSLTQHLTEKGTVLPVALAMIVASAATIAVSYSAMASADTATITTQPSGMQAGMPQKKPGAHGTITAINGTTITISTTARDGVISTMTVDGSQAKFMKMPERPVDTTTKPTTPPEPITISISDLKVGDAIMAKGTVSGTTIAATEVMTGTFPEKGMGEKGMQGGMHDGMKGDHIHGTVTAVSGTTITVLDSRPKRTEGSTVTETTETTYTVDAASAKVLEMPARPADEATAPSVKPEPTVGTLSDIAVGDTVGIRGTISGTTIVATEIMDGIPPFGHMMPGQNQNQ